MIGRRNLVECWKTTHPDIENISMAQRRKGWFECMGWLDGREISKAESIEGRPWMVMRSRLAYLYRSRWSIVCRLMMQDWKICSFQMCG